MLKKFLPKPSEAIFLTVFAITFLPEVDNDVISGMAAYNVGMLVWMSM